MLKLLILKNLLKYDKKSLKMLKKPCFQKLNSKRFYIGVNEYLFTQKILPQNQDFVIKSKIDKNNEKTKFLCKTENLKISKKSKLKLSTLIFNNCKNQKLNFNIDLSFSVFLEKCDNVLLEIKLNQKSIYKNLFSKSEFLVVANHLITFSEFLDTGKNVLEIFLSTKSLQKNSFVKINKVSFFCY